MTIAAGFFGSDGILLCADSLYTGGTKVHQSKLFGYRLDAGTPESCSVGFALAGHEDFGKMAIEDCIDAIKEIAPYNRTLRAVKQAVRNAIKAINDQYVDTRPSDEKERARFELIIAAHLPRGGGLQMLKTSGAGVTLAEPYHCTGIGAYLGDYLMRGSFYRRMEIRDAALIAIHAFAAAKSYDATCGGATQFLAVLGTGRLTNVIPYDIQVSEVNIAEYDKASRNLLSDLADSRLPDQLFDRHLQEFAEAVKKIRSSWRQGVTTLEYLMLRLSGQANQPDHQSTKADPTPPQPSPESPEGSDGF